MTDPDRDRRGGHTGGRDAARVGPPAPSPSAAIRPAQPPEPHIDLERLDRIRRTTAAACAVDGLPDTVRAALAEIPVLVDLVHMLDDQLGTVEAQRDALAGELDRTRHEYQLTGELAGPGRIPACGWRQGPPLWPEDMTCGHEPGADVHRTARVLLAELAGDASDA